jgi:hypothetical protein
MSGSVDMLRAVPLVFALIASSTAAFARNQEEPVAGRTPDAQDVAMTPITDLNLKKDPIPPVLLAAAAEPYADAGLTTCAAIRAAIEPLDAVLGPDMDVTTTESERVSAGAVAKSVVASFIPFRGVIRELTGAADHQREFQAAIYAGAVRRGFLKGLGQQKGCPYPARPAFARVAVAPPAKEEAKKPAQPSASTTGFVSKPVVQPLPQRATRGK